MPFPDRDTRVYRRDAKSGHKELTAEERIKLIKPYLPSPPGADVDADTDRTAYGSDKKGKPQWRVEQPGNSAAGASLRVSKTLVRVRPRPRFSLRRFAATQLYQLVFLVLHAVFSAYLRLRGAYHGVRDRIYSVLKYHHRTPEIIARDVRDLARLPKHLSVVLQLQENGEGLAEIERLVSDIADIAAWCASAGIPMLSVYEKSGIFKTYFADTHRAISRRLTTYFGRNHPAVTLKSPHVPSIESHTYTAHGHEHGNGHGYEHGHITVLLISEEDGRDSLVDLTKTLAEMAQHNKIAASDISMDLIDAELSESVMSEPDLLLLFGPHVELAGFPPWQIRLTEVFHVPDNHSVGYQVFLWGLQSFAKAEFRVGR